jgi:histidine triad (HIT) family protein
MSADCLFCKIVAGQIPVKAVYEDDLCLCFPDIAPQAPTHFLMIPREHIVSLEHAGHGHAPLLGHMMAKVAEVARARGLSNGYRVVINTGVDGGQTVKHFHLHLLGGRHLGWPPG